MLTQLCKNHVYICCCLQGLIWTAGLMYNLLHYFNIPIHVQEVWSRLVSIHSAKSATCLATCVNHCHCAVVPPLYQGAKGFATPYCTL